MLCITVLLLAPTQVVRGHDTNLSANELRRTFFNEHDIDDNEYQLGLSRGKRSAKIWHAGTHCSTSGDAQYFEAKFNSPIPHNISLELFVGYSVFDEKPESKYPPTLSLPPNKHSADLALDYA